MNKGNISFKVLGLIAVLSFAAGASLVLFARPAGVGGVAGNNVTVPFEFSDTVALDSEVTLGNCGSRSSVVVPAIRGGVSVTGGLADSIATSVTVTGLAAGDVVLASWSGYATGTLQDYGLTMTARASTTNQATVVFTNTGADTSTAMVAVGGTLKVCYFD